jgi:hypothetical protein
MEENAQPKKSYKLTVALCTSYVSALNVHSDTTN